MLLHSITLWNRVEGRPRTINIERALRVEVRDALWMLTRQCQVGEFAGEDAGSPVRAKLHVTTARPSTLQRGDAAAAPFGDATSLEAQVAAMPLRLDAAAALDWRLVMGQRWLALIAVIGGYKSAYIGRYRFALIDATCGDAHDIRAFNSASGAVAMSASA